MQLACFVFVACPIFGEFVFQSAALLSLQFALLRVTLGAALSHCPRRTCREGWRCQAAAAGLLAFAPGSSRAVPARQPAASPCTLRGGPGAGRRDG